MSPNVPRDVTRDWIVNEPSSPFQEQLPPPLPPLPPMVRLIAVRQQSDDSALPRLRIPEEILQRARRFGQLAFQRERNRQLQRLAGQQQQIMANDNGQQLPENRSTNLIRQNIGQEVIQTLDGTEQPAGQIASFQVTENGS